MKKISILALLFLAACAQAPTPVPTQKPPAPQAQLTPPYLSVDTTNGYLTLVQNDGNVVLGRLRADGLMQPNKDATPDQLATGLFYALKATFHDNGAWDEFIAKMPKPE